MTINKDPRFKKFKEYANKAHKAEKEMMKYCKLAGRELCKIKPKKDDAKKKSRNKV